MSEQTKALEQIVANAESGVSVTYLTGNAGTGKTYTAQQLIKLIKEGTVLKDWKVLDCAPQGKASDIAAGAGDGTTMQSLFKINNRMVLPLGVGYMKYYANRDPVAEVATQAKKSIMKKLGVKSLKRERILLYIEEVMAASAEDLAAVRMIMQNIAESDGVKFHILAVGHPLQNIDDYTEEVKEGDEVVCTNYRTPAFDEPRWDNGDKIIVTHHSFFKDGANWITRTIHLKENKRQGDDPLGAVLDKWTTGAAIGEDLLAILPKGNIHTFAYGMQANKVPVSSFITPAISQERKINSALVNCEGAMIFLPYIKVGAIEGHIVEYSAASCSVKLAEHGEDAEWIEIPNINKTMFRNCMRSLPVDIHNVVVPSMQCLFRNNGVDYKNGTVGRIISLSFSDKLVEVEKENGENIVVEYIRSKELKGDSPFEFKYLPLMTMYAVTTGKVQGCTFNHPVAVCIDARNKSPKPHAAYVGMSRVTNINDLHIVISNVATEDAVDLSRAEMINQAMVIDTKALAFHAATTGVSTNVDCTATPENTTVAINTNTEETETTMDLSQLNSYVSTYVDIEEEGSDVPTYYSTPENPITCDGDDADNISEADIPESASIGALGGDYIEETEEPNEGDIPESTSMGSLVDSILGESNELIDALEAAEEKLEATEVALTSAQATIAAQAKEIETLKAQLAAAQKAANDAAIEAKNAKAEAAKAKVEAETAKANAVPREELLAMRAILDRILGAGAPVVETAAPVEEAPAPVEDIPYLDETSELPTTTTTTTTTVVEATAPVEEAPAPNGGLTFRVEGDTKNLKLKKIVADLTKLGFVYQDAGDVNVILTTAGANDINKGVFNIDKPAGRQLLTEYAGRLVKA